MIEDAGRIWPIVFLGAESNNRQHWAAKTFSNDLLDVTRLSLDVSGKAAPPAILGRFVIIHGQRLGNICSDCVECISGSQIPMNSHENDFSMIDY